MVLDGLSGRVSGAFNKALSGTKRLTESSVGGALKEVKRALLDSDVNLAVVNAIVDGVAKRAVGTTVLDGVTAEQQFIKLMYDELVDIMGGNGTQVLAGMDREANDRPQVSSLMST